MKIEFSNIVRIGELFQNILIGEQKDSNYEVVLMPWSVFSYEFLNIFGLLTISYLCKFELFCQEFWDRAHISSSNMFPKFWSVVIFEKFKGGIWLNVTFEKWTQKSFSHFFHPSKRGWKLIQWCIMSDSNHARRDIFKMRRVSPFCELS